MNNLNDEIFVEVGKQLRNARIMKHWSLRDLSLAMKGKKSKSTLKRYEDGTSKINVEKLSEVCTPLGLNVDDVMRNARDAVFKNDESANTYKFTERERNLIDSYRNMSPEMQDAIDKIIQNMSEK